MCGKDMDCGCGPMANGQAKMTDQKVPQNPIIVGSMVSVAANKAKGKAATKSKGKSDRAGMMAAIDRRLAKTQ